MTEAERCLIASHPLLLYDGVCVLCNGLVCFVIKHDAETIFRFAPLESSIAKELLADTGETREGVVLIKDTLNPAQQIYYRSDAVSESLLLLGGRFKYLGRVLAAVPYPLRELGYGVVARLRYRLFGRYTKCPVPEPGVRSRMVGLD